MGGAQPGDDSRKSQAARISGTAAPKEAKEGIGDGPLAPLSVPSSTPSSPPARNCSVVDDIAVRLTAWRKTPNTQELLSLHDETVATLTGYSSYRESLKNQPAIQTVSDSLAVCLIHTMLSDLAGRPSSPWIRQSRKALIGRNGICFSLLQAIVETPAANLAGHPAKLRLSKQPLRFLASSVFGLQQAFLSSALKDQVPLEASELAKSAAMLIGELQKLSLDKKPLKKLLGTTIEALTIAARTTCAEVVEATKSLRIDGPPQTTAGPTLPSKSPAHTTLRQYHQRLISAARVGLISTLEAMLATQEDARSALSEAAVLAIHDLAKSAQEFGFSEEARLIRGAAADLLKEPAPLQAFHLRNNNLAEGFAYVRKMLKIARPVDEFPRLPQIGKALVQGIQKECRETLGCLSNLRGTESNDLIRDKMMAAEIDLYLRSMLAVAGGRSACKRKWQPLFVSSVSLLKAAQSIEDADILFSSIRALARSAVVAHTAHQQQISHTALSAAIDALPTEFTPDTANGSAGLDDNLLQTMEHCGYTVELLAYVARRIAPKRDARQKLGSSLDTKIAQLGVSLKDAFLNAPNTIKDTQEERTELPEQFQVAAIKLLINLSRAECHLGRSKDASELLRSAVGMAINPHRPISHRHRTALVIESIEAARKSPDPRVARLLRARFQFALKQIAELPGSHRDSSGET